jgi:hypothetical protein
MRNIVTSTWTNNNNNYEDMDEEHSDEYMDDRYNMRNIVTSTHTTNLEQIKDKPNQQQSKNI